MSENRFQEWIDEQVAKAPPLTDEQRSKIARLLSPVGGGAR